MFHTSRTGLKQIIFLSILLLLRKTVPLNDQQAIPCACKNSSMRLSKNNNHMLCDLIAAKNINNRKRKQNAITFKTTQMLSIFVSFVCVKRFPQSYSHTFSFEFVHI